jgi:hypothetical protein
MLYSALKIALLCSDCQGQPHEIRKGPAGDVQHACLKPRYESRTNTRASPVELVQQDVYKTPEDVYWPARDVNSPVQLLSVSTQLAAEGTQPVAAVTLRLQSPHDHGKKVGKL